MVSTSGAVFAVDCRKCDLPGATSVLTIWNVQARVQAGNHPSTTEEAIEMAKRAGVEATVWQGDVLVAYVSPVDGVHMLNGHCVVED